MTCSPDYLVMGMSAVTFYGGAAGADAFQAKVERESGVGISVGSHSCTAALKAYGGVKRIAFLSPYYPVANAEVRRYFGDKGFSTVRDKALECKSWINIAEQTSERLRTELKALDGDDVDAIIQVGTNLSMVRLAAAAELWLGKPVIAINTATYGTRFGPTELWTRSWALAALCPISDMSATRYGSVTVDRVIDLDPFALPLGFLFPDASSEALKPFTGVLGGTHVDMTEGHVLLAVQSHVRAFRRQDDPDRYLRRRAQGNGRPRRMAPAPAHEISITSRRLRPQAG
jgi:hypothetical protein